MAVSLLAATLLAGAAMAADDPVGVVSTAPAGHQAVIVGAQAPETPDVPPASAQQITAHGLSTEQQIDRWIGQRSANVRPFADDSDPWTSRPGAGDDRKMHGEVSAAIGTNDFSAYSAAVSIPIGDWGRLDLRYSESKNGYGYGYGYPGYGYGYGYGGYDPFFMGSEHRSRRSASRETAPWDARESRDDKAPERR